MHTRAMPENMHTSSASANAHAAYGRSAQAYARAHTRITRTTHAAHKTTCICKHRTRHACHCLLSRAHLTHISSTSHAHLSHITPYASTCMRTTLTLVHAHAHGSDTQ